MSRARAPTEGWLEGVSSEARDTNLVDEVLAMIITELLSPNDPMHVRLHEFLVGKG